MNRIRSSFLVAALPVLFSLAIATNSPAQSFVYNRATFATGAQPNGVVMADFNGDGRLDLAVANSNDTTISILLGKPDGTMSPKVNLPSALDPQILIAADFNGDGKMDLAVTYGNASTETGIEVYLGNGDGSFKAAANYSSAGSAPYGLAVADVNHDGKLDLVVADGGVSVLLGNGDGTFGSAKPALNNQGVMWVAVADFNQDGNPDLAVTVVANTGYIPPPSSALILLGNGDGTFQTGEEYRTGTSSGSIAVADFTGDGVVDLIVAADSETELLVGNGDGTFQTPTPIPQALSTAGSVALAADFNGDGKMDFALGSSASTFVFLGNGDGTFQLPTETYGGNFQSEIALGDVNSDGSLDIAQTDLFDDDVILLLGNGDGTFGPVLPLPALPYYQTALPYTLTAESGIIADFTGDGKPDLAFGLGNYGYSGGALVVFPGNGDGTLGTPVISNVSAVVLAPGDFNEDGKMDIAFGDSNGAGVALSNGDGSFGSVNQLLTSLATPARGIVVGDFNNDKHADVVVMANGFTVNPTISVYLGNGDGTFRALNSFWNSTQLVPTGISAADFNHDGNLDLVVTANPSGFAVLFGNGDGTFQAPLSFTSPDSTNATVGDVNGDGNPDILVSESADTDQVYAYLGTGNGTFGAPVGSVSGQASGFLGAGDFNGDGKLDVAILGAFNMALLTGNGDGTFNPPITVDIPNLQGPLGVGDFNQDGLADAVVGGEDGFLFMARPVISMFPGIVNFGTQIQDTSSASKNVTVTNVGAMAVKISQVSATNDFNAVSQCGASLAKGATCTIGVTFSPSGPGLETGTLLVHDNSPAGVHALPLVGVGTGTSGQTPQAGLAPTTLTFPGQTVGTTSASQTVTLSNSGSAALTISNVATTGDFSQTNNCGASVNASGSCAIQVSFAPTKGRVRIGTLTVTDNSVNSPQVVTLSGMGNSPHVGFGSTTVDFGVQMINTTSLPKALTVSNSGPVPLSITNFAVSGDYSLAASGTTCSTSSPLGAGASCAIQMTFSPTSEGSSVGTLTLTDNDDGVAGSMQTVALTGSGTNVTVSLSGYSLSFIPQLLGTTSAPQTITVSNTGSAPLSFSNVTVGANFNQTNNCGSSIGVGGNCTISVTFSPTALDTYNANLTISDGATNSPQVVGLSGDGDDFELTLPTGVKSSVSIPPGSTANYPINVGQVGTGGVVILASFTCTGAPAESVCGVSPSSFEVGVVGGITVSVTTTAPSQVPPRFHINTSPRPRSRDLRKLVPGIALVLVLFAFEVRRRKGWLRWNFALPSLAAGVMLILALSGCGGSGGGGGGSTVTHNPGTPAGTYTLTITGTATANSASSSHTMTLTLVVT